MRQESGHDGEQVQALPWMKDGAQIILILVGLIASGKSTFAKTLEEHIPQFRRCNQDDLGSRQAVERLARETLRSGLSVCIDRTNFDQTQRAHWIQIAREIPGTRIWCLVFDTPLNVCRDRLQYRTDHPTIHSVAQGEQVLYRFANMYRPPTAEEGFDRIYTLKPQAHPSSTYTQDELLALLVQIANSPPPVSPSTQLDIQQFLGSGSASENASQNDVALTHDDALSARPVWTRGRAWAGAGRTLRSSPRGCSRLSGRGFRGYANHGRGMAQDASTNTSAFASAGINSFGGRGRGYHANALSRRSETSSSWRQDRRQDRSDGAQESHGEQAQGLGGGSTSSLLSSPVRRSQDDSIRPGDTHRPDVAYSGDGSAESPFMVD